MICYEQQKVRAVLIAAFVTAAMPYAIAAEPPTVSRADAEAGCSFYVASVVSRNEDLYPREFVVWRHDCEHHPDKLRCKDVNDTLARRRPEPRFYLKCG